MRRQNPARQAFPRNKPVCKQGEGKDKRVVHKVVSQRGEAGRAECGKPGLPQVKAVCYRLAHRAASVGRLRLGGFPWTDSCLYLSSPAPIGIFDRCAPATRSAVLANATATAKLSADAGDFTLSTRKTRASKRARVKLGVARGIAPRGAPQENNAVVLPSWRQASSRLASPRLFGGVKNARAPVPA